ncbi:putative maleylacetate reductase [Cadophora sp. MPI-SDFR-AT-0126]|nr:putative maleylacetate reductase [Leotiomycetes sp. MPI-SDFR-AT-0126]
MEAFEYNVSAARIIFGGGTVSEISGEVARQKLTTLLLLSTPEQDDHAYQLKKLLNGNIAGVFSEASMHTPSAIIKKALTISIRTGLPHICIPKTYTGSEMTPILGETQDGQKTTRIDPKILPGTVIYDVDLTMTLPTSMSATSGVNAIAHAVEALYARNTNPIISLLALEGVKSLADSLPRIVESPTDVASRQSALYGAWLCGTCLGAVGMSLHHKLCHILGGSFNMPHAETHTIILPHALAYNSPAIPEVMKRLADVLPASGGNAITGLNVLLQSLKVKRGLKDFGFKEEDVDKAAQIGVANPYWNPRAIEIGPIRELLRRAWAGEDARADL